VALIVVGGSARGVGKTSVVCGLIARLPEYRWTAIKIAPHHHGSACGSGVSVCVETDSAAATDSSRYLAAGAVRSLWIAAPSLPDALPRIREEIARSENAILESNSILDFLAPDLYLSVVDPAIPDCKPSARRLLPRAHAILIASRDAPAPLPTDLDRAIPPSTPRFSVAPPHYVTEEVANFVRARLSAPAASR
jgi:hypothetical protein